MGKVELILTRHGETLENQKHILQGQLPGVLSSIGRRQAEELADKLEGERIDVIVCSDLARSFDTAQAVAARRGLVPQPTILLREMDWGIYTGETLADVDWDHLPAGVESVDHLFLRAGKLITEIKSRYAGKQVLVVGHGAFNRAIVAQISKGKAIDMIDLPIMENTECLRFII